MSTSTAAAPPAAVGAGAAQQQWQCAVATTEQDKTVGQEMVIDYSGMGTALQQHGTPECPSTSRCQVSRAPDASGVTAPNPVTTTRLHCNRQGHTAARGDTGARSQEALLSRTLRHDSTGAPFSDDAQAAQLTISQRESKVLELEQ